MPVRCRILPVLVLLLVPPFLDAAAAAEQELALQPFAQMVRRLEDALNYLGQPLPLEVHNKINDAVAIAGEKQAVAELQKLLDAFTLVEVQVDAESKLKAVRGPAKPQLVENGTRLFLVKLANKPGLAEPLTVESPNSGPTSLPSRNEAEPKMELTQENVKERWADISVHSKPPMGEKLLGLPVEYRVLEVYSRDRGQRSAEMTFRVGSRASNAIEIPFTTMAAREITLRVRNENGEPAFASFIVKDLQGRLYPNPSKRLAPDFPFQPQVYRTDGEKLHLPLGYYTIEYSGGPEYFTRTKELPLEESGPDEISFQLQRWVDPSKYGWWSGDHHVHASGCSHYKNPTEGVEPEDMLRQALGENLAVSAVLTWGPSWYHQKQYFSAQDHPLSKQERLIHYDVEVSGFPSSHAGHLVLMGLKEDDYPGTTRIEEWPSWNTPVLKWAKSQGAVTGYSHSGWGLQVKSDQLPNYEMPGFDSIGANEYIVNVTDPDTIDFISTVDTPFVWELNIWYHTLNVGFRTRVSGETDFPCIYDDKVGLGRSYVKLDKLDYRAWVEGVKQGRTYVSDGLSHLMDFTVNGVELGTQKSEVALKAGQTAHIEAKVAAYLEQFPDPKFAKLPYDQKPYWNAERARVPGTREVPVELIVNGEAVATKNVLADGQVREVAFDVPIKRSSWIALRILPSSHTNPVFAIVDGAPIRASRRSAEWCLAAVNQCWTQKVPRIREGERETARKVYDHAREVYTRLIQESVD